MFFFFCGLAKIDQINGIEQTHLLIYAYISMHKLCLKQSHNLHCNPDYFKQQNINPQICVSVCF